MGHKDKESKILQAALGIFAAKGYYRAKVEEIALEAGVGKGTVYEYFSSKRDLFRRALLYAFEAYARQLKEFVSVDRAPFEQIVRILDLHVEFYKYHCDMARVLLADHPARVGEWYDWFTERRREIINHLAGMVEEGMRRGLLKKADPEIVAHILIGAVAATAGLLASGSRPKGGEAQVARLLLDGLGERE